MPAAAAPPHGSASCRQRLRRNTTRDPSLTACHPLAGAQRVLNEAGLRPHRSLPSAANLIACTLWSALAHPVPPPRAAGLSNPSAPLPAGRSPHGGLLSGSARSAEGPARWRAVSAAGTHPAAPPSPPPLTVSRRLPLKRGHPLQRRCCWCQGASLAGHAARSLAPPHRPQPVM